MGQPFSLAVHIGIHTLPSINELKILPFLRANLCFPHLSRVSKGIGGSVVKIRRTSCLGTHDFAYTILRREGEAVQHPPTGRIYVEMYVSR